MRPSADAPQHAHPPERSAADSARHALVVQPHQRDHLGDVVVAVDPPRRHLRRVRVDRVRADTAGGAQLGADLPGEAEVRGAIAVQVADLAAGDGEGELAAAAGAGLDAGPRRDLAGDALVRGLGHEDLRTWWARTTLRPQPMLKSR